MVSQEFMNILHKQSKHNSPTMSSNGDSADSEGMSQNVYRYENIDVKVENESDYVPSAQSDVGMASVHTNLKTEVEDYSNDMAMSSLTQVMVSSESSSEATPHQASKGKERVSLYLIESPQQHIKEEEALPLFSKRIIKKKQIYDPSDISISSQKNQTKKSPLKKTSKGNKEMVAIYFPESPQQHVKEEKACPHFKKRLIKKKQIYDPSDISITSQKNQMKKSSLIMRKARCNARTHKLYMETPELEKKITGEKICAYCGKYIKREDYMRLHLMKHTGETPHKCPKCPKAYRYRWRLTQHIRLHTKNFPYHCPYCNYCGNRSDYLSSHIRRVHH